MTEPRSLPSHFTLCVHSLPVRVFLLSPHFTLSFHRFVHLTSLSQNVPSPLRLLTSPFTHLSVRSPLRSLTSPFAHLSVRSPFLLSPFLLFVSPLFFHLFLLSPSFASICTSICASVHDCRRSHLLDWVIWFDCSHLRLSPLLFCFWYDIHQCIVAFLNLILPIFDLSGQFYD